MDSIEHRRFDSFDAFQEAMPEWDVSLCQVQPGRGPESFSVSGNQCRVEHLEFEPRFEMRGAMPSGYRVFGFASRSESNGFWRGRDMGPDDIGVYPIGGEMDAVTPRNTCLTHVFVPMDVWDQVCRDWAVNGSAPLLRPDQAVRADAGALMHLRCWLERIETEIKSGASGTRDAEFRQQHADAGPRLIVQALLGGRAGPGRPKLRTRDLAVKRAVDYLSSNASADIRIRDIVRIAGVSERTLDYAFRERFDLSPRAYLQARRLNLARSRLSSSEPDGTVAEVAMDCGFTHLGRFAQAYRQMFGELPSQTLLRASAGALLRGRTERTC